MTKPDAPAASPARLLAPRALGHAVFRPTRLGVCMT